MDVQIRRATPDDAMGIVEVLNPIIAARIYTVFDTPFSVDDERRYIAGFPARGVFHVAVNADDGSIVGFQNMEPIAAYTRGFDHVASMGTFVDLRCRRQGIASRLFDASFAAARQSGFEKAFTFVRADNPSALATYLRHGFEPIGLARRQARIDGRYIDEVLIERFL